MVRSSTFKKLFITTTVLASIALSGCETTTSGSSARVDLGDLNDQLNDIVSNNSCTASFQCKVLKLVSEHVVAQVAMWFIQR